MNFLMRDNVFLPILILFGISCEAVDESNLQSEIDAFCQKLATQTKKCKSTNTTKPKVAFLAWFTKTGVSLGDGEAVKFDRVLNNIGGGYDPRTGHFEAPVTGIYSISASVMSEPSNSMRVGVMKNSELLSALYSSHTSFPQASQTINLPLKKGDTMWIQRRSGRMLHARSDRPYNVFSGVLIDVL